jgi:hypothetical protein
METSTINETTQIGIELNDVNITAIIESSIHLAAETIAPVPALEPVSEPVSEPVQEPVSELTKTIQTAALSALLRIVVTGQVSSLSVHLDKTTTTILLELLDNSPKSFDSIQELIQLIVQDGKINTSDIPNLLKLVTELYPLVKHSKLRPSSLDSAKIVGTIIKVVIRVLVNEHRIKISNPSQFLKDMDGVVDSAIELLSLAKSIKQSRNCSKLFRK